MAHFSLERSAGGPLEIPLQADRTRVGREDENEIVIDESWISSVHAEFFRSDGMVVLRDLGSSNGTTVNGQRVREKELRDGDEVGFGLSRGVYREHSRPDEGMEPQGTGGSAETSDAPERGADSRAGEGLPQEIQAAAGRLEEIRQAAVEAGRQRASAREELRVIRQEAGTAGELRDELNSRVAELRQEVNAMEAELTRNREMLDSLQSAAGDERRAQESLKAARAGMEQELEALRREREDVDRSREETRSALQAARKELEQAAEASRQEREKSDLARQEARDELNGLAGEKAGLGKEMSELRERRERQETELRELLTTVAGLKEQADRHGVEAARWPALREAAEAALAAVQADLVRDDLAAKARAGELDVLTKELTGLRASHARLEPEVSGWEKMKREAAANAEALETMRQESAELTATMEEAGRHRQEAEAGVRTARSALRDCQDELADLEARRDQLRVENAGAEAVAARTAALRLEAAALEQQLARLTDRLSGMENAPDPNWGTVHALAMGLIRMVDFAGDLAAQAEHGTGDSDLRTGLLALRDRLLDLLREYSVEAFLPEAGAVIDPVDLRRITVVETRKEGWKDGVRVLRAVRSGYHCLNGGMGITTLLRKAEVVAVEAER